MKMLTISGMKRRTRMPSPGHLSHQTSGEAQNHRPGEISLPLEMVTRFTHDRAVGVGCRYTESGKALLHGKVLSCGAALKRGAGYLSRRVIVGATPRAPRSLKIR
jgi:hypothetical protein